MGVLSDSAEMDLPHILSHLCTSHTATPGDSQTVDDYLTTSNTLSNAKGMQWTHERAVLCKQLHRGGQGEGTGLTLAFVDGSTVSYTPM